MQEGCGETRKPVFATLRNTAVNRSVGLSVDHSIFGNPPFGRSFFTARGPPFIPEKTRRPKGAVIGVMERLLEMEIGADGAVTEEIELICTMTGFKRRFLTLHIGEGFFRSVELEAS
jgi:hypothetical protein